MNNYSKNKTLKALFTIFYWIVQLTWGLPLTLIGFFFAIFVMLFCHGHIHKVGCSIYIECFSFTWGGLNLGAFSFTEYFPRSSTPIHEFGHSIQNMIFGPLMLFVVTIPSAIRYWYDIYQYKHGNELSEEWYYSVWFERTASEWGNSIMEVIR